MPSAQHNTVVRSIANYYKNQGEEVQADHLKGWAKPPVFEGKRGGRYMPDVYRVKKGFAYEVEDYFTMMNEIYQIKAFYRNLGGKRIVVVLCSGTTAGAKKRKRDLEKKGIRCRVINYRDLPYWNY